MSSIRGRLGWGLTISIIAILILQWWVASSSVTSLVEKYVESRLVHDIEGILSSIEFDENGKPIVDIDKIGTIYKKPFSGHYYKIIAQDGFSIRSRSLWDGDMDVAQVEAGESLIHRAKDPQGEPILVSVNGYRKQGFNLTIAAGEDISFIETSIMQFQKTYSVISAIALLLLIIVQWRIIAVSLKPLHEAKDELLLLERGEVESIKTEVPTEIAPFIIEINRLLLAMGERLRRSRNSLGNLAHSLKTPLTTLKNSANDIKTETHKSELVTIGKKAQEIQNLIERELARSRLAGYAAPGQAFLPEKEIPDLIDTLKLVYSEKNISIDSSVPVDTSFQVDREDMMELLGVLLDNACKWGKSEVLLEVTGGNSPVATIEDDGPGCPPEKLDWLVKRGVRLDETIAGHGLGLAIASDIVEGYRGKIEFSKSEKLGGLKVVVTFAHNSLINNA